MIRSNYHTHTVYCDGKSTVDQMARAALDRGMRALGFSGHSHTSYDESYCMSREDVPRYAADVRAAAERYAGRLEIYLGVEDDLHGERPEFRRDYTIGSAHELFCGGCVFQRGQHRRDPGAGHPGVLRRAIPTGWPRPILKPWPRCWM